MKFGKANTCQLARNIAVILKHNPEKLPQLEKAQAITVYLTSDDHCEIEFEMYDDGIERYIVRGTRATFTLTAKEPEHILTRKPRNAQPWYKGSDTCWISDIFKVYEEITGRT